MANERSQSWRRFYDRVKNGKGMGSDEQWRPEKKWKMLYLRSEKLSRAKQLRFDYPRKSCRQLLDSEDDGNDKA